MEPKKRSSFRGLLSDVFWSLVGIAGLGGPIVDRHAMYGGHPKDDPYRMDFDLITPPAARS